MTPQAFTTKWGPGGPGFDLNERQGAQPYFMDLCALLGVPTPGSSGDYIFEQDALVLGAARGYADVFKRDHFAWENKAPGKNLDAAVRQLLTYSLALSNPPLLVVCDRLTIRIHTQFNGHPSDVHTVLLQQLDQPEKLALLRRLWTDPQSFRPKKTSRDITEAAARSFAHLAEQLRNRGHHPDRVAHFLTQCLFCFFAEDVGLLPGRMFERLVGNRQITSDRLTAGLDSLFAVMRDGGLYGPDDIPWFNGGLFKRIDVPKLEILDITELRNAAGLNWSAIDVSIFGTLFERGLDPAKRSQLGAHYTDPATIGRLVEPVIQRPLLQIWEREKTILSGLLAKSSKKGDKNHRAARDRFILWLERLKDYRVLDPACGSGNFLFMGLKALKDIEHRSHLDAAALGLDREADLVTGPHNVLGIELNEYAAELARVTVWIGELQWRLAHGYAFKTNPVLEPLDHIECRDALLSFPSVADAGSGSGSGSGSGVLAALGDGSGARAGQTPGAHTLRFLKSPPTSAPPTPRSMTALVEIEAGAGDGSVASVLPPLPLGEGWGEGRTSGVSPGVAAETRVTEAPWPKASVVIGNPPFLGDKKMRAELGDAYTEVLRKTFEGRVPGGADLVCYWFEKARAAIEHNGLGAAGLVATNSIRGGKNRAVLDAIAKTTRIYEAWGDEGWVNEGAAVRVSLVAFGHATQGAVLDGQGVSAIHADLTAGADAGGSLDLSQATSVNSSGTSFIGTQKGGPFDVPGELARNWLRQPNPHGRSNAEVLAPWINGLDITRRPNGMWIVDFDTRNATESALFELPWAHCESKVRETRADNREGRTGERWWLLQRARPEMKAAIRSLSRYVATARNGKHRLFMWQPPSVVPDSQVVAITRADDTTFGILHSRFHELWSLRMCTWLGVGNDPRYTPTTCFETFPFPTGLTPADTAHQRTETLEGGAVIPYFPAGSIGKTGTGNWGQSPISPEGLPADPADGAAKSESDPKFPAAAGPTTAPKRPAAAASKESNAARTNTEAGMGRMSGAASNGEAYEPPASAPSPPAAGMGTGVSTPDVATGTELSLRVAEASPHPSPLPEGEGVIRAAAVRIAIAAHRLNALREAWLNPPEWTQRVPEVVPLGLDASPYPDRIEPKPGLGEADLQALKKRTLTKLYNLSPAWLTMAHQQLDAAVAAAYGWTDYTPAMPDDEILKRLLALNLAQTGVGLR